MDKSVHTYRTRRNNFIPKLILWAFLFLGSIVFFLFRSSLPPVDTMGMGMTMGMSTSETDNDAGWERRVVDSARTHSKTGRMTVLVTGAAGFVGSHVSVALKRRGDGVVGIDNFNNHYDPTLKRDRQVLLEREGVYVVEGDINDDVLLFKLFDLVTFTHVMHLAAQTGVTHAARNPLSYIHSNIAGLVNVFEVCKSVNPQPAIVWASSSSVYGLNSKTPFSETDRTDHPATLYAATKKAGEEIAHSYNHIYGLSITGLRFFTVYGPWGRPDMAYFSFTKAMLEGKTVHIYEGPHHGSVARDFTYIDDIVHGCLGALDTATKSTGSGGKRRGRAQLRTVNLGNTAPVAVGKLVKVLEELLKVNAKKQVLPLPENGDVQLTHANVTFARHELHYKASTDLKTGLKKFIKWYVSYYQDDLYPRQ